MFYYKKIIVNPTLALTKLSLSTENQAGRHYFKIYNYIFYSTKCLV